MRIVRFAHAKNPGARLGAVEGDEVVCLAEAGIDLGTLLGGPGLHAPGQNAQRLRLSDVTLQAPVGRPPKFLGIGLNYEDHIKESKTPKPEHQLWFNKQSTCVIGPGAPIHIPRASDVVDYEGELAFIIGRRCRHVAYERASEVIAGYTVANDVSVRDWQFRTPTMTMGKSFDTHGPLGPWLVTADELEEFGGPHDLRLRTWVNGDLRQDARTSELIFDCFNMVEHLSSCFTLEPGDVISTGTPAGVGIGRTPPELLRQGDIVRIEIEGIGVLENPVIDEPLESR